MMDCRINEAVIHYVEHGTGVPLVALHGVGVDHRELESALEPMLAGSGCRRIYPDLPAMGHSTATGLTSNNDVAALLGQFVERTAGEPALVLGHSYGAYLARGVAAQRPALLRGLALVCPLAESTGQVPVPEVVVQDEAAYDELEPEQRAGFDEYFVVRTAGDGPPVPRLRGAGHGTGRLPGAHRHLHRLADRHGTRDVRQTDVDRRRIA